MGLGAGGGVTRYSLCPPPMGEQENKDIAVGTPCVQASSRGMHRVPRRHGGWMESDKQIKRWWGGEQHIFKNSSSMERKWKPELVWKFSYEKSLKFFEKSQQTQQCFCYSPSWQCWADLVPYALGKGRKRANRILLNRRVRAKQTALGKQRKVLHHRERGLPGKR